MTIPLVTIGMPAYNHGRFVGHAIESVLGQTVTDWELIIVDDASTDNTLEVIRRYGDPRIKVIALPQNRGPGYAANQYLREVRGRWISLLPSDDAYAPTRLEEQLAYLERRPECGMVTTQWRFINEDNQPIENKDHFAAKIFDNKERSRSDWLRFFFDEGNNIAASTVMFDKKYIDRTGPNDARLLQLQDYDMWLRFVLAGCNIGVVPKPLTDYRILEKSGNLSAPSLNVYHRCLYERTHILKHFLSLTEARSFCEIFPEVIAPPLSPAQENVWVKHQFALRAWKHSGRAHAHFALETWFDLFADDTHAAWLGEWGISLKAYQELMAKSPLGQDFLYDVYYWLYLRGTEFLPIKTQAWLKQIFKKLMRR